MRVKIKLFASLRQERFKEEMRDFAAGITVGEVAGELAIAAEDLGVILVNGRHGGIEQPLNEGDTLSLFPLVGGG